MSYYLWAVIASVIAIGLETFYRKTTGDWMELLPFTFPFIVFLNYALFKLLRSSDGILTAFLVFSFSNLIIRTAVAHFVLRDHISKGIWIAMGLLLVANLCKLLVK